MNYSVDPVTMATMLCPICFLASTHHPPLLFPFLLWGAENQNIVARNSARMRDRVLISSESLARVIVLPLFSTAVFSLSILSSNEGEASWADHDLVLRRKKKSALLISNSCLVSIHFSPASPGLAHISGSFLHFKHNNNKINLPFFQSCSIFYVTLKRHGS